METTTILVQITVIAIPDTSPSSPIYTGCHRNIPCMIQAVVTCFSTARLKNPLSLVKDFQISLTIQYDML